MFSRAARSWTLLVLLVACGTTSTATTPGGSVGATTSEASSTEATASSVSVGEDCETNLAAIQALVDEGGTFNDLSTDEQAEATAFLGAATNLCDFERRQEFSEKDDVAAWLGR